MIESLVEQIEQRFADLSRDIVDPEVIADRQRYADVGRAYRQLETAAKLAEEWRRATDDAAGARERPAEGDAAAARRTLATPGRRRGGLQGGGRPAKVQREP